MNHVVTTTSPQKTIQKLQSADRFSQNPLEKHAFTTARKSRELGFDVGVALGAREHGVGFVVVLEALKHRIPVQVPRQLHSDVMKQTSRASSMPNLDRGRGWFARVDALDPIRMLLSRGIKMNLIRPNHRVKNLRIARHKWFNLHGWRAV
jgi:hypothetical protein